MANESDVADKLLALSVAAENAREGSLTGYDCRICRNKGYTVALDGTERRMRECECVKARQSMQLIEESGLKDLLERCTFESFQANEPYQERAKRATRAYLLDESGKWLGMFGQTGSGKTHLCTAVCGELLRRGEGVRYLKWVDFVRKMERLRYKDDERAAYFGSIADADVLYIDDLFKWEDGDFAYSTAFELLDHREKARKRTILTGEKYLSELRDPALAGRIRAMCGEFKLEIARDDKRNFRLREGADAG